jgi:hypothetical protein
MEVALSGLVMNRIVRVRVRVRLENELTMYKGATAMASRSKK